MLRQLAALVLVLALGLLFPLGEATASEPAESAYGSSLQTPAAEGGFWTTPPAPDTAGQCCAATSSSAVGETQTAQRCCRVCRTGKACGNSCINRSLTCRQPPGCACNG